MNRNDEYPMPSLEWGPDEGAHAWHDVAGIAAKRGPRWRLAEQEEWCDAPFEGAPPDEWFWMRTGAVINPHQAMCRMGRMVLPYARVRLVLHKETP